MTSQLDIQGITFDVARTLMGVDQPTDWRSVSAFLVDQGLEIYEQELKAAREYVFMLDLARMGLDNWYDWTRQILIRLNIDDPSRKLVKQLASMLERTTQAYYLYDDVLPLFTKLRGLDLQLSALTTIPEFKLQQVMAPIRSDLHHIIHGGNAGCSKGNPRMYQLDLEWKGVKAVNNLFIGDHPYFDIELPKRMGQRTVHLIRQGVQPEESGPTIADITIESLEELGTFF